MTTHTLTARPGCVLCFLGSLDPADNPTIDGEPCHRECYMLYLIMYVYHETGGEYGPHKWTCVPCEMEALRRKESREDPANNPHRAGTKVAARWQRERARLDWAMDLRSETYWSM